jgi:hypothetical protein
MEAKRELLTEAPPSTCRNALQLISHSLIQQPLQPSRATTRCDAQLFTVGGDEDSVGIGRQRGNSLSGNCLSGNIISMVKCNSGNSLGGSGKCNSGNSLGGDR